MPDTITQGTRIPLLGKWYLDFEPRDNGSLQAFIHNDERRQHASLAFALEMGFDSSQDETIPQPVLNMAQKYAEYE